MTEQLPNEPWMTKRELARYLKCSTKTVERHVKPYMRVGNQNRYIPSIAVAELRGVPEEGGNVVRLPLDRMRGAAA